MSLCGWRYQVRRECNWLFNLFARRDMHVRHVLLRVGCIGQRCQEVYGQDDARTTDDAQAYASAADAQADAAYDTRADASATDASAYATAQHVSQYCTVSNRWHDAPAQLQQCGRLRRRLLSLEHSVGHDMYGTRSRAMLGYCAG